eukprot:751878-Hanusia_phi.AAC.4
MHYNQLSTEEKHSLIKVNEWLKAENQYSEAPKIAMQERNKVKQGEGHEAILATHRSNIEDTTPEHKSHKRHLKKSASKHHKPVLQLDDDPSKSAAGFDSLTISPSAHDASESSISSLLNLHFSWSEPHTSADIHKRPSSIPSTSSMNFSGILDTAIVELLGTVGGKFHTEEEPAVHSVSHDEGQQSAVHDWENKARIASWRARCVSSHDSKDGSEINGVYAF